MGPFDGAGVSILGILFFAALAFVVWIFNRGRAHASATKCPRCKKADLIFWPIDNTWACPSAICTPAKPAAPPEGLEHFLACDQCGAETDKLLKRGDGPDLCPKCFALASTSNSPASNKTSSPSGTSG